MPSSNNQTSLSDAFAAAEKAEHEYNMLVDAAAKLLVRKGKLKFGNPVPVATIIALLNDCPN